MPVDFYHLEFDEYLLLRKGYFDKVKMEASMIRTQTALIVEGFIGKGNGIKFVMGSWQLDGEESPELTREQLKELLKKKREHDALKRLKSEQRN